VRLAGRRQAGPRRGPTPLSLHDRGLSHALPRLLDRRRVLGLLGGLGPHIHFEVYRGLDAAQSASSRLRTTQLACPRT